MLKPPKPGDETARLMSLHSLHILDTPSEDRYDRITKMAKRLFGVEICLVSLVDSERQWFKSKQGLDVCETSREVSFCGHAILKEDVLVVTDAAADIRFADNPLVAGEPHIRFYAGCPIKDPSGFRVGTFCIIDSKPRTMSGDEIEILVDMAAMVEDEIRVSSQVTIDDLTQVANRRGFHMIADHLLSLCRRTGNSAELAFFDLDGFKAVNDDHGHAAGDDLLKYFAELLVKCFRKADAVGRVGGDEFVVLLSNSSGGSHAALQRLRAVADKTECDIKGKLAWSVGTVEFDPERHANIESMLAEADSSMYDDKANKRLASS
ncbi:MAG: sensor domain-containing diguanylate cyclase [Gammaproteobacteria bacterium]|nr:sensor domain-containing diguanylate cyclase [Gammaproteobacteria bacterium]NNL50498.1 sensor domain-containing diguanylate cyclase [Woeseiaceae bacterium]